MITSSKSFFTIFLREEKGFFVAQGLPGPKEQKRPNLVIGSFKKAKFSSKNYFFLEFHIMFQVLICP